MNLKPCSPSLLISLSTYPDFDVNEHVNSITSNYREIKKAREDLFDTTTEFNNYFENIVYHLWGFWDVCVISVVDNAEIVSTLIEKEISSNNNSLKGQSHSKLFSGISFKNIGSKLNDLTKDKEKSYPFIGIVNLKFSSDWYLPLGNFLSYSFLETLNTLLEGYKFYPIHSFTTYDITLIILNDNLEDIASKIFEIREMKVSDLNNYNLSEVRYKSNNSPLLANESHLFIDTQSYFGTKLFNNSDRWSINTKIEFDNIDAIFEIESKPGHTHILDSTLDSIFDRKGLDKLMKFQSGHSDFFVSWAYNLDAFNKIHNELRNENSELRKHIRKIKTKLLFSYESNVEKSKNGKFVAANYFKLSEINDSLKMVKVSKSLRNQIVKLFYLYQDAFKDRVNYNIYIDLFYFVKNLETIILSYKEKVTNSLSYKNENSSSETVRSIERELRKIIEVFKNAFYMRFVNDRSIENIRNFLIPYNSQMQTIVSFYDSYAKSVLEELTDADFGRPMVLTFSDDITQVNQFNIQLLSNNLFEPGLIFNALSKELITIINQKNFGSDIRKINKKLKKLIKKYFSKEPYQHYIKHKKRLINFQFEYGIVDYLRYTFFFNSNLELFLFYHIGFNLQYPKLYDSNGNMNQNNLFEEAYRIVVLEYIIKRMTGRDDVGEIIDRIHVPPGIRSKWRYYVDLIRRFVIDFESEPPKKQIHKELFKIIEENKYQYNYDKLISEDGEILNSYIRLSYNFMEKVFLKATKDSITYALSSCRDWNDGKVKKNNIHNNHLNYYPYFLFDSQGGTFFIDFHNLTEYTQLRNKVFEDLRGLSLNYKSQLYNEIKKNRLA